MRIIRVPLILLAIVTALSALFLSLGMLGITSPVQAQEQELTGPTTLGAMMQAPAPTPDYDIVIIAHFTDDHSIDVMDLSGNVVGEGVHMGELRCQRNKCSRNTDLIITVWFTDPSPSDTAYEYKFKNMLAFDPVSERIVVDGKGKIYSRDQNEQFSFTATFQNNGDGTVWVTYVASHPDASFIIRRAPGRLIFQAP